MPPESDRPTRELRATELQHLLRTPNAVNLEVDLEVVPDGTPLHVIDENSSLAIPIDVAAGSDHAITAVAPPRARIAMRALTAPLRYPVAPGSPVFVRALAIAIAVLAAILVAQLA